MKLYCYHIAPIDFWCGALTEAQINASVDQCYQPGDRDGAHAEVKALKAKAESAFRKIGSEGDTREGPFFFAVPSDTEMALGYIVKQDNNGACFIASPVQLSAEMVSIFSQTTIER